jgi:hypothetical protein
LLTVLVFGSIAWASHQPDHQDVNVDTQQVTLGPGGSVVVSGTIVCEEGFFEMDATVLQRSVGNKYNTASTEILGDCTGSPVAWESDLLAGSSPYHRGSVSVLTDVYAYQFYPDTGEFRTGTETEIKELRIRR